MKRNKEMIKTLNIWLAIIASSIAIFAAVISLVQTFANRARISSEVERLEKDIKTAVISERCYKNLLRCSIPIAVSVPDESTSSVRMIDRKLEVKFDNRENGSGVAFQFTPSLNLENLYYLELNGVSTKEFEFIVEFKVRKGNRLDIVGKTAPHIFPATNEPHSINILLPVDTQVDEIVINFLRQGDSSNIFFNYFRLR